MRTKQRDETRGEAHPSEEELDVAELLRLEQAPKVVVEGALGVAGELESEHLPAPHIVVHRAPKHVHGVPDHGRRVE